MRRAHQRAEEAVERAQRMREMLRRARGTRAGDTASPTVLYELAAEETARSLREKDRFIALLAHELRQPLNAALAAARVAEMQSTSPELAERARAIIQRQLQQLTVLLDDMSEVSRLTLRRSDLRREPVDVVSVLRDAVETVQPRTVAKGVALDMGSMPQDAIVAGDRSRLYQVFSNLLGNAIRYTPRGGRVELTIAVDENVVVTIADTGQGIEAEHLQHIFEPFARGGEHDGEGLGIGLALVRSIVDLHGGWVGAESAGPDTGSTFTVRLPLKSACESSQ